jgi:hypothetical protein
MSAPKDADPPLLLFDALAAEVEQQRPGSGLSAGLQERRAEAGRQLAALDWNAAGADDVRRRLDSELVGELYAWLHEQARAGSPRSALCLSGGGIRSATFALGVVQGLARRGLLGGFDFLSTVSGGGYLGSWLSAWIDRRLPGDRPPTAGEAAAAVAAVAAELAGPPERASALHPEPEPVRHLRSFSRFLSPRLGFLSADTWTLVGTYLRNLSLNWLVLLPLLALGLILPRFRIWFSQHRPDEQLWQWAPFWLAAAAGAFAIAYIVANRPSLVASGASRFPAGLRSQPWFLLLCLAPLVVMVLALTVFWAWVRPANAAPSFALAGRAVPTWLAITLFAALLHLAGYLVAFLWVRRFRLGEALAVAASGALGGILTVPVATRFPVYDGDHLSPYYAAFAGPLVLWLFLIAATLFVGLASRYSTDADREWLARAGSWMLIAIVVGGGINALVIFGPPAVAALPKVFATLGGLSGLTTALLGRSGKTPAKGEKDERAPQGAGAQASSVALTLAAPLFALLLVAALSLGTTFLVQTLAFGAAWPAHPASRFDRLDLIGTLMHSPWWVLTATALALLVPVVVMGSRVDVNRFSLHGAYRDRLIRAYLGASRLPDTRRPDPFTGFDEADNLQMHALRGNRPLHVVNVTLNLVHGSNLAWQDRKAESFTISPLHCGSWPLGYRDATRYGLHPGTDRAISLGTALAISGAAASPNMGYHSSPVVGFLLAFFNVRLGWWLGNPGRFGAKTYAQPGPRFAPRPLISETFGLTDDRHPYVYLSDGGHFDNLGLYEMVVRRCRYLVVVDAEGDAEYRFEGLGLAVSKIRTDFGVPIEFAAPPAMRPYDPDAPAAGAPVPYYALGRVRYSCVDGTSPDDDGWLLYVKASLNGSEPLDVLNYAKGHSEFPHESTANQFYSESQFESYRALGSHAVDSILAPVPAAAGLGEVFALLAAPPASRPLPV